MSEQADGTGQPGQHPAKPGRGAPAAAAAMSHPGRPFQPGYPNPPGQPSWPGRPVPPAPPAAAPADPGGWPEQLYERLLEQRVIMASGHLDDDAATRLCAQLLTLNAEGDQPVRLELQNLDADLPAALTVMGVLDVVGAPVRASVAGRLTGPAIGVLAACRQRLGYPNAILALAEPTMTGEGTAATITAARDQIELMLDQLYIRLAEVTGREVDEVRDDARGNRHFSVGQAISYGLLQATVSKTTSGTGPG